MELTETALISNPAQTRRVVEELREHDIHLSIDDFGAGFTSFRYLGDFTVSEIKIDRSFITSCTHSRFDQSLVKSLVVLCDSMGIPLVAEGVETAEAELMLAAFGCHCAQGYGIARPMAFEHVLPWVAERARAAHLRSA
nr:EAL domain-containing protein [Novosphingobium sp. 9]